jgi:hypothetical protein
MLSFSESGHAKNHYSLAATNLSLAGGDESARDHTGAAKAEL